jgi:hypothetical protein
MAAIVLCLGVPFREPFAGYGLGAAWIMQLVVRPGPKALGKSAGWGLILGLVYAWYWRWGIQAAFDVTFLCGILGVGSFLSLCLTALWAGSEERAQIAQILFPAGAMAGFMFSTQRMLNLPSSLHPATFDFYAFAFDGSMGTQLSFLAGQWMVKAPWRMRATVSVYESLPLWMALVYGAQLRSVRAYPEARKKWAVFASFAVAGLLGWAIYCIFPVCGPKFFYLSYPRSFPGYALMSGLVASGKLVALPLPSAMQRNGMPSLHMCWAFLIAWHTRCFRWSAKACAALFVAATAFATVALGEHYVVDLVVAVPFTLLIIALCHPFGTSSLKTRISAVSLALGLVSLWLVLLRFQPVLFWRAVWIPWALILLTMAAVLLEAKLLAQDRLISNQPPVASCRS